MIKSIHPFKWLPVAVQKRAFAALLLLTIVLMLCLQLLDGPLKTDAAPVGIVSFELAGNLSVSREIMASWGSQGQIYAALSLGLDFLFLVVYAGAIGLGCVLTAHSLMKRIRFFVPLGLFLAWGQIGAALLDVVENYALILILLGTGQEIWPVVAKWCALPKFLLVATGIVYVLGGAVISALVKPFAETVARSHD